ncbi:MAG: gliding motility lipoprotein GldD [Sphingobacteriaceae bacterium]|nr:gliding motility lipoprotein GldD [Sphingobacteriaceae bacterium]
MKNTFLALILVFLTVFFACNNQHYAPKPRGFFKINYPKKEYRTFQSACAYQFDYPVYGTMLPDNGKNTKPCWFNLDFKQFNGQINVTYFPISSIKEYESMVEDARKLAMKHTVKADEINQVLINYPDKKVYGIYYEIEGNTASSVQFFLTDSTKHYFRGALYFNERPAYDSIAPVIKFIKKDIDKMIATFKWKN